MPNVIVGSVRQFSLRKSFYQKHSLYDADSGESFNTPGKPMTEAELRSVVDAINEGRIVVCYIDDEQ
jgi:hypothetical protein